VPCKSSHLNVGRGFPSYRISSTLVQQRDHYGRFVALVGILLLFGAVAAASESESLVVLGDGPAGPQSSKDPRETGGGHNPAPGNPFSLAAKSNARPTPWVSSPPIPGIIESRQAPFFSSQYSIQNQWFDVLESGFIVVYAGKDGDTDQGLVIVQILDATQRRVGSSEVYRTPQRAGSVRIVSARGRVLLLQSIAGATFSFDVIARKMQSL